MGDSERLRVPAVAVFARAPTPGKAKTRLIPLLGARGAAAFQVALISDAIRKVEGLGRRVAAYFFLAGGGRTPVASWGSHTTLMVQRGAGLGERLERAFRQLLCRHGSAVIIGTDSPTMPPQTLREALGELRFCDAVLGPCPDGGYYLIGLRRLRLGMLRGIRWGSAFAFRDTLRQLLQQGFSCSVLGTFRDVDRPGDVERLRRALVQRRGARRVAPSTWRFFKQYSK